MTIDCVKTGNILQYWPKSNKTQKWPTIIQKTDLEESFSNDINLTVTLNTFKIRNMRYIDFNNITKHCLEPHQ